MKRRDIKTNIREYRPVKGKQTRYTSRSKGKQFGVQRKQLVGLKSQGFGPSGFNANRPALYKVKTGGERPQSVEQNSSSLNLTNLPTNLRAGTEEEVPFLDPVLKQPMPSLIPC